MKPVLEKILSRNHWPEKYLRQIEKAAQCEFSEVTFDISEHPTVHGWKLIVQVPNGVPYGDALIIRYFVLGLLDGFSRARELPAI